MSSKIWEPFDEKSGITLYIAECDDYFPGEFHLKLIGEFALLVYTCSLLFFVLGLIFEKRLLFFFQEILFFPELILILLHFIG